MREKTQAAAIVCSMLLLGGCFDDDSSQNTNVENPPTPANAAPVISGTPPRAVLEGDSYEFAPIASDADGDVLQFSIDRKPAWAEFDPATGRITGTPTSDDVGNFTNITIHVSDGLATAALAAFDISVDPIAVGAATLNWLPPTANSDGSALTDLAGYRIYYGRNPNDLARLVVLDNPGLTSYVVENLPPAIWYFAMTSLNAEGVESVRTELISKTIT